MTPSILDQESTLCLHPPSVPFRWSCLSLFLSSLFPYLVQPILTSVHPHPPLIHVDCWLPMFPMCAPLSLWPAMWHLLWFHPWAPVYKHAYNLHLQIQWSNPYPHSTHMLCFPFWPYHTQIHWTAFFSFYPFPIHQATGLMAMWSPCTILSCQCMSCTILIFCCDMDLVLSLVWYLSPAATITTTSGIGGVQIPITLVSSTTGLFTSKRSSIWTVQIVDLDFRSEFLCQSSNLSQNLQIPLNHLICLGYLPCPCNPVSPICPQTQCSYRVPQTEAAQAESQTSEL